MKQGRPPNGEDRDDLVYIGFKADPETLTAIQYLIAAMQRQSGVLMSKSTVIRHYLIEAARQLYTKHPPAPETVESKKPTKPKATKQAVKKTRAKTKVEE